MDNIKELKKFFDDYLFNKLELNDQIESLCIISQGNYDNVSVPNIKGR